MLLHEKTTNETQNDWSKGARTTFVEKGIYQLLFSGR